LDVFFLFQMKRYLITGASRGIGRAIAEKLASAGDCLLLHGRDREALARTCELVEAKAAKAILLCYDLRDSPRFRKWRTRLEPRRSMDWSTTPASRS
jgi:short-subunit dehydrogenase